MLAVIRGVKSELWTSLPGIIVSFNADAQTVEVQPAIKGLLRGPTGVETWVNLPVLPDVPVVFPSGGGFTLTFPIKAGDECLVVFSARCIDAWWQSGGTQQQIEQRLQDLSDGFCIPGPRSQPRKLAGLSTSDVQLRTDDGAAFVAIKPSGDIQVTSPTKITLTAPDVTVEATNITLQGNTSIIGSLTQSGGVGLLEGPVTVTGDLIAGVNVISLNNHHHIAVNGGPEATTPPVAGT
jgi:hypothetical protein